MADELGGKKIAILATDGRRRGRADGAAHGGAGGRRDGRGDLAGRRPDPGDEPRHRARVEDLGRPEGVRRIRPAITTP